MMNDEGVIEFSCPQSLEAVPGSSGLSDTGLELDVSSLVLAPAPSFRFKELAKDTDLNLSPTAKQRQVHADYLNQLQAMQPTREPRQQMSLRFHQGRVELAGCGYEYGLPEYGTMPPLHIPMPAAQGTTPAASQASDGNDEPVHFLGPAENIKTLFKLPYSRNRVSLAIHRVGNTLVVDGDVDEKDLPKGFDGCNEVLRIGHSAQFNTQPLLEQEESQPNAELYENFIYQSTHLAISPPASMEKDEFTEAVVEQKAKAPKVKLSAKEKKRRAKLKRQMAAKTSASYDTSSLPNVVPSFQGILKWKFQDMQMILGSDVQLFSNKDHPAVSLKLHDADQDLSLCTVLDYYLDNVIANIPELAICMHSKGHVRGYQLVQTRDIPYLNGSTKPLFDIRDVNMNATMLFKFLQHNCSEPNGTYWLYRAEGDYSLRLYDVRMLSKGKQRKWKYMMAMLCYRFASRAARLISSAFEAPSLQNRLRHRQRELLSTCLDLLEELRQDQTGSRAQDSISASVAEQMADTYLRELDDKMSCSDKISRLRQAKQHLQHSIQVSENCVRDYCVELEHKQQMKQAANTNSLPVSESLALSPSMAPSPMSTAEWTDEELDDEDEDDDMRLFMEEEVVRLQLKHSSANLHLAALYMETKAFADMLRSLHDACMYIRIADLPEVSPISFDSIDSVGFFQSIVSELDFGAAPMKSASKMSVKQCFSMDEVRACVLETIGDLASSRSLGMPDMSFVRAVVLTFSILTGGTKLQGTYLHEVFSSFPLLLSKFTMDLGNNLEESCLYLAFFAYLRALSPPVNAELYFVLMKKLGNAANEFGKFYLRCQEHNKAYLWFEGGSVIFEAIEDGSNAALLCANLSNLHKVLAEKCVGVSDQDAHYTKSVALCQKAYTLLKQSKATHELHAKVTGELALTYLVWAVREGSRSRGSADCEAAVVEKFNKALNMYIELGDARQVASTHYQMASFYNRLILSKSPIELQGVALKPRMELTRRHYEKALQYFSTVELGKTFVLIHQELAGMYAASDKVEDIEHALLVLLNTYQAYQILHGLPIDEQTALNALAPNILENIQNYLMRIIRGASKGAIKAKVATFKEMYKEAIYNHDAPLPDCTHYKIVRKDIRKIAFFIRMIRSIRKVGISSRMHRRFMSTFMHRYDNAFLTKQCVDAPLAIVVINGIGLLSGFDELWPQAKFTICADGGANRLFDAWKKLGVKEPFVPQFIKGDLDSIRPEVSDFFEARGSVVIKDLDQDSNDLDKCMALLETLQKQLETEKEEKLNVLVLGAMGGRFDQEMQNINALYRWSKVFARMTLFSDCTTAMLLWPGKHSIRPNFDVETRTCGLIPLGGTCNELTTEGLKWNLTKFSTAFGGLVSSSNHCLANEILVENSDPLIWTTELKTTK